jgi:hypothetical protein
MFIGEFVAAFIDFMFHKIGYSFYLGSTSGLADDKEVGNCFGYFPEVE